jgi:hypothetical protein
MNPHVAAELDHDGILASGQEIEVTPVVELAIEKARQQVRDERFDDRSAEKYISWNASLTSGTARKPVSRRT